jgi:DNA polymerase elongation subunit (family B)
MLGNTQALFDLFLLDIETVPQYPNHAALPAEGSVLFFDKISKTVPENADKEEVYLQRAGILAEFGKIICISTGYFYTDKVGRICLKIKSIYGHDEKELLHQFVDLVEKFCHHKAKFQFAGHNIREFDIPYICRRMVINNITLPTCLNFYGAKPWEICMTDTLQWWKFGDYKNYTSLHLLASVLGIPTSKDDIDGSMVQHVYYQEKNLERIVKYCEKDVIVVARIIQRFKNITPVESENIFFADSICIR